MAGPRAAVELFLLVVVVVGAMVENDAEMIEACNENDERRQPAKFVVASYKATKERVRSINLGRTMKSPNEKRGNAKRPTLPRFNVLH